MFRIIVNIIFILLLSLEILPVREFSAWVLAKQFNSKVVNINDDDDDADDNSDIVKKVDFKLKFQLIGMEEISSPLSEIEALTYHDFGILFPKNHAAEVQTPPPNSHI